MKKLTLLRHAKAADDGLAARDIDRPLNAKGRKAARTLGRHLRETGTRFDAVVASPAARVAETVEEVQAGYGRDSDPRWNPHWDRRIYLASVDDLMDVLREQPREAERLLLVGHNPGLEDLALELVRADDDRRDEMSTKYPTGTLAEIELPIDDWAEIAAGTGGLARFIRPRDLDPALGPEVV